MPVRLVSRLLIRLRPSAALAHRPFITIPKKPLRFQVPAQQYAPSHIRTIHQTAAASMFIQTATTPNPSALKFIPGIPVLPAGVQSIEYLDGRETHNSPLARKLFAVDGVRAVFYGPDFITVTKSDDTNWNYLKPEVFSLITEALNSGASVVTEGTKQAEDTMIQEGDSETVGMIKELLDTRIRPAIQEDGGDIEYRGFENGHVFLKLRGACRTCDSSTVTLKNGIENMLMHYVEGVEGVTQVLDEEEEIAIKEFEKFEEKLRQARGIAE
ncbi:hypothetical protein RUND412_005014 [Rhizina undulata]